MTGHSNHHPPRSPDAAPPRLVLASGSPRRKDLLTEAGYLFVVDPADIDETFAPGTLPSDVAVQLAEAKARVVANRHPTDVVLAADTVVAFGDRVLGKPTDPADARNMLALLSGTTHIVITGVSVVRRDAELAKTRRAMSAVRMRNLTRAEIDTYVESGEWRGKAGGYGIQDADPFVTRMSGSHTNIVGLPMTVTHDLLAAAGVLPGPKAVGGRPAEA